MTSSFQDALLKFLFQYKEAKAFKDYLDDSLFDVPQAKFLYSVWEDYVTRYNNIPVKAAFIEFTDKELKRSKQVLKEDKHTEVRNSIAQAYTPSELDIEFTADVIIEFARRKGIRNVFTTKADKIKHASVDDLDAIGQEVNRVLRIGRDSVDDVKRRGGRMVKDYSNQSDELLSVGHPTFLRSINSMTSAGGFYPPQGILLAGGPKAFKTGILLKLAVEYARSGLNVFIADAENGLASIKTRLKQTWLECERQEVPSLKPELAHIMKLVGRYGGEIVPHAFSSGQSTLADVEAELQRLDTEENWRPNVIIYCMLQLFQSTNKKLFKETEVIQDVYKHAKRINTKYNTFYFTEGKLSKSSIGMWAPKPEHIGKDFDQAFNADSTWVLCRTEDEVKAGTARIIPMFQREGVTYNGSAFTTCAVKITEAIHSIEELDSESYLELHEEQQQAKSKSTAKRKYVAPDTLKDT